MVDGQSTTRQLGVPLISGLQRMRTKRSQHKSASKQLAYIHIHYTRIVYGMSMSCRRVTVESPSINHRSDNSSMIIYIHEMPPTDSCQLCFIKWLPANCQLAFYGIFACNVLTVD